ncbi:hypothetical protein NP603_13325 [Methylomonas sp. SURF-1]|uniref:Uncharacterized protein n=1 Tax=Methylomonas aurea TaxID=2952224 RepID=A0ABT1UJ99_9GAMM|nr:hypothetical protein [Methylomonas sp. SURF-1]MCQ8182096.1 hypothetical protein [Methylomonas sp. SURF-1]
MDEAIADAKPAIGFWMATSSKTAKPTRSSPAGFEYPLFNFAMAEARMEMSAFSTLAPDRIDLLRTSSLAIRGLKYLLE